MEVSLTSSTSRKALRKARKATTNASTNVAVLESETHHSEDEQAHHSDSVPTEDVVIYECCICSDDFLFASGVAPCEEHFLCNGCVIDAFNTALNDSEAFPAKCCSPIQRSLVEHLLSPEVISAYKWKAKEHYTSRVLRVYCVNDDCRRFIPDSRFDNSHSWYTVARCSCGTCTCVGCKQEWEGKTHRCLDLNETGVKPSWLPEYSDTCRIKQCPTCRMWIEHKEACNHMTCCYCRHQFCFVCLQPWTEEGFHEQDGCPSYGDPAKGYDEEGFERDDRGLHRDTGYNRDGMDRFGRRGLSHVFQNEGYDDDRDPDTEDEDDDDEEDELIDYDDDDLIDDDEENIDREDEANWDEVEEHPYGCDCPECTAFDRHNVLDPAPADEEQDDSDSSSQDGDDDTGEGTTEEAVQQPNPVEDAQAELEHPQRLLRPVDEIGEHSTEDEDETVQNEANEATNADTLIPEPHPRTDAPSARVRQQIRQERRIPILAMRSPTDSTPFLSYRAQTPTFIQLDCHHTWSSSSFARLKYFSANCAMCKFSMPYFFYYCTTCGIVVCQWCSRGVSGYGSDPAVENLLDVIVWAEGGMVPFKRERHRGIQFFQEELENGETLGVDIMMDVHEAELFHVQPFLYWDFGVALMFEQVEWELRREYWAVTEENVGVSGCCMTFALSDNSFAPLFWDGYAEM